MTTFFLLLWLKTQKKSGPNNQKEIEPTHSLVMSFSDSACVARRPAGKSRPGVLKQPVSIKTPSE